MPEGEEKVWWGGSPPTSKWKANRAEVFFNHLQAVQGRNPVCVLLRVIQGPPLLQDYAMSIHTFWCLALLFGDPPSCPRSACAMALLLSFASVTQRTPWAHHVGCAVVGSMCPLLQLPERSDLFLHREREPGGRVRQQHGAHVGVGRAVGGATGVRRAPILWIVRPSPSRYGMRGRVECVHDVWVVTHPPSPPPRCAAWCIVHLRCKPPPRKKDLRAYFWVAWWVL